MSISASTASYPSLLLHQRDVAIVIVQCPGNEEDPFDVTEVSAHLADVDGPPFIGSKSAASKQKSHCMPLVKNVQPTKTRSVVRSYACWF